MKKFFGFVWETVKLVIISLAIVLPIRYFLIQPFFVHGSSMEPSFANGHYLVINEIGYRFQEPARGEVIVFRYPFNKSQYYIKRIIALPNEAVEVKNNQVFVYNKQFPYGLALDESSYLPENVFTPDFPRLELGEDEYFVLGDNRGASSDSRQWGPLDEEYIIGRVWLRAFPLDVIKIF